MRIVSDAGIMCNNFGHNKHICKKIKNLFTNKTLTPTFRHSQSNINDNYVSDAKLHSMYW